MSNPNSLQHIDLFSIFGIKINNVMMQEAIELVINSKSTRTSSGSKKAYFINANSLNQAFDSKSLSSVLNKSDYCFADGAGVRIAAKQQGIQVKDNVNGTDMLPLLCAACCEHEQSIFLLGAEDGVAKQASQNLTKRFPGLKIAGTHHGHIANEDNQSLVKKINESGADILLVAMGTPLQESWIEENAHLLNTNIALAVGGLFDFYSGRIPRAPLFMRKLGVEWIWRLANEPVKKFKRYVIGNPLFLLRLATYQ
ncbi:MAG: WecB/TagA/CpsF family glycosyltransferase [Pseudomonadales bacterium]|nr:WecB/TagA/CpsF family glycosyltransferase [Pseudomonadales bacterium]